LCGEWKVTHEEEMKFTHTDGYAPLNYLNKTTENYLFDGVVKTGTKIQKGTYNITDGQNPVLRNYSEVPEELLPEYYTESYKFNKNETFSHIITESNNGKVTEYTGTWKFLQKDKDLGRKNKEYLVMTYTINNTPLEYCLIELRSKEIQIQISGESYSHSGMGSTTLHRKDTSTKTLIAN
jgi:hypothetical protein